MICEDFFVGVGVGVLGDIYSLCLDEISIAVGIRSIVGLLFLGNLGKPIVTFICRCPKCILIFSINSWNRDFSFIHISIGWVLFLAHPD